MALRQAVVDLMEQVTDEELRVLERYAHYLQDGHGTDPMIWVHEHAPPDDEPSLRDEDESADEAWQAYGRGEAVSADEVKRMLLR